MTFSLSKAVLFAIRNHPGIQSAKLSLLTQEFNLAVQKWQFKPHYNFQANANYSRVASQFQPFVNQRQYNLQPSVSLQNAYGTQVNLALNNPMSEHYNPNLSAQIIQPLIRGFGKPIVEAQLHNAEDSLEIATLNMQATLRTTITAVILAYLDYMNALQVTHLDEEAIARAKQSVVQTKLYIKAGHKAGTELIGVEAEVANALTRYQNDKNLLQQSRYALLAAIGLAPETPVSFQEVNVNQLIQLYDFPKQDKIKNLILAHDVQYQTDQIILKGATERALLIAKDNTRWQLNFTATGSTGGASGGGQNAGFNSIFNGINQSQSVGLSLQIPIDDQLAKQALLSAKVALKQARIALEQERWAKETGAMNSYNNVLSNQQALLLAENAANLQQRTYELNYQKYLHGLIDSLSLQTAQSQLIQAQNTLLTARIAYLKSLVNLDALIGATLKTWHIPLKVTTA